MIKFALNPNEQIVLIVRKHWIAIIGKLVILILAIIFPLVLLFVLPAYVPNFPGWQTGHLIYLYTFFVSVWFIIFWTTFFFAWTEWHLDIWVVTTHRIFIVEQKSMFFREISSLTLDKIQDLTIDINGFLPTMLKFGKIFVETAGEHKDFEFSNAKNPEAIKIAINSIQKDFYSRPVPIAQAGATDASHASAAGVMSSPNSPQSTN